MKFDRIMQINREETVIETIPPSSLSIYRFRKFPLFHFPAFPSVILTPKTKYTLVYFTLSKLLKRNQVIRNAPSLNFLKPFYPNYTGHFTEKEHRVTCKSAQRNCSRELRSKINPSNRPIPRDQPFLCSTLNKLVQPRKRIKVCHKERERDTTNRTHSTRGNAAARIHVHPYIMVHTLPIRAYYNRYNVVHARDPTATK